MDVQIRATRTTLTSKFNDNVRFYVIKYKPIWYAYNKEKLIASLCVIFLKNYSDCFQNVYNFCTAAVLPKIE